MINYASEIKRGKNSVHCTSIIPDLDVNGLIYILEIITRVGKHFPVIFLSLASLNALLAANDFLANSTAFGILNSLFAASGFIFLVQMHHNKKMQPIDVGYNTNPSYTMEIKE